MNHPYEPARKSKFLDQRDGQKIIDLEANGCYVDLDFWQVNIVDVCHSGIDRVGVNLDRGDICSQVSHCWWSDHCLSVLRPAILLSSK
jgi:hypothetical protein